MIYFFKNEFREDRLQPMQLGIKAPCLRQGAGFFETMLYNGRSISSLDPHMDRLYASMDTFSLDYRKIPVEDKAMALLAKNHLEKGQARIDVVYPVMDFNQKIEPLLVVEAYEPEPKKEYALAVYPRVHVSYLSQHRSLSHLHFVLADQYAVRQGCDESVLLDPLGNILETPDASLIFYDGSAFYSPPHGPSLQAISLSRAMQVLPVREETIPLRSLDSFRHVYRVNSLTGVKPVVRLGDFTFEPDWQNANLASIHIL